MVHFHEGILCSQKKACLMGKWTEDRNVTLGVYTESFSCVYDDYFLNLGGRYRVFMILFLMPLQISEMLNN